MGLETRSRSRQGAATDWSGWWPGMGCPSIESGGATAQLECRKADIDRLRVKQVDVGCDHKLPPITSADEVARRVLTDRSHAQRCLCVSDLRGGRSKPFSFQTRSAHLRAPTRPAGKPTWPDMSPNLATQLGLRSPAMLSQSSQAPVTAGGNPAVETPRRNTHPPACNHLLKPLDAHPRWNLVSGTAEGGAQHAEVRG